MKISGLSCITKKIFLVFLGHPNVGSRVNGISWELVESSKLILDIVKRMTRLLFRASH